MVFTHCKSIAHNKRINARFGRGGLEIESHDVIEWFDSNEVLIVYIGELVEQNRFISKVGYVILMPLATFAYVGVIHFSGKGYYED